MSDVDRLALVCKVLLDQRFLELKRENERLILSLFWVDHSINTLKKLMCRANNRAGGPRCRCRCCTRTKRYYPNILDGYDDEGEDEACKFGPWFEKIVHEHGLSFAPSGRDDNPEPWFLDRESYPMADADVHFLLFPTPHAPLTSWRTWVYGAKLWKAQTTQDPSLMKLTALFKTLGEEPDWLLAESDDSDSESWHSFFPNISP
jgi:hypothetical protein